MLHHRTAGRVAALLLALILLLHSAPVYAVSSSDTASGTDAAASGTDVSGTDVSGADAPFGDGPADLELGTVKAKAALLVDLGTLEVLYEQNADEALPPASTTKIMTALLVMEAIAAGELTMDENVVADSKDINSVPWDASTISPRLTPG